MFDGFTFSTDRYVDNRILVSSQVWRKQEWLEKVSRLLPYIKAVEKVLKIKPIEVRFASMRYYEGLAYEGGRYVEIDIKPDLDIIKTAIAHEAIHCQQMQTKRYVFKNGDLYWEGLKWKCPNNLKGYAAYRAEPHEVEAYTNDSKVKKAAEKLLRGKKCQKSTTTSRKQQKTGKQTTK